MNKKLIDHAELCFQPVKGFERLKLSEFEERFQDDVADLDDDLLALTWRVVPELGELIELSNGYALHIDRTSRYSLFETRSHFEKRTLYSAWAEFVRGAWSDKVPQEPGLYFVRDRDLGRRSVRELQRVNGRLLDVSGGLVPPGQVTCWRGQWWSRRTPSLPNSY